MAAGSDAWEEVSAARPHATAQCWVRSHSKARRNIDTALRHWHCVRRRLGPVRALARCRVGSRGARCLPSAPALAAVLLMTRPLPLPDAAVAVSAARWARHSPSRTTPRNMSWRAPQGRP